MHTQVTLLETECTLLRMARVLCVASKLLPVGVGDGGKEYMADGYTLA